MANDRTEAARATAHRRMRIESRVTRMSDLRLQETLDDAEATLAVTGPLSRATLGWGAAGRSARYGQERLPRTPGSRQKAFTGRIVPMGRMMPALAARTGWLGLGVSAVAQIVNQSAARDRDAAMREIHRRDVARASERGYRDAERVHRQGAVEVLPGGAMRWNRSPAP